MDNWMIKGKDRTDSGQVGGWEDLQNSSEGE